MISLAESCCSISLSWFGGEEELIRSFIGNYVKQGMAVA